MYSIPPRSSSLCTLGAPATTPIEPTYAKGGYGKPAPFKGKPAFKGNMSLGDPKKGAGKAKGNLTWTPSAAPDAAPADA